MHALDCKNISICCGYMDKSALFAFAFPAELVLICVKAALT